MAIWAQCRNNEIRNKSSKNDFLAPEITGSNFFGKRKPMLKPDFDNCENPDGFVTSLTPKKCSK